MNEAIVLVGFMGAGKTTIGARLATDLDLPLIDTDALIVADHGPIAAIFDTAGEERFRELERDTACRELERAVTSPAVVVLGGGAVTVDDVREALSRLAHVVWLDAPPDVLFARATAGDRPLARDAGAFRRLYERRRPLYEAVATVVVVCGADEDADSVVRRVVEAVR